ncbi:hypothetical protein FHU33_0360 [Blastococcus colisei]|uniref:Tissue inhibitor of metalloproteinase n=1 Tax=Blastococcus colisei TaxID=1564162 RepID=A0A543PAA2_9ACTN|nr:hypothetical protein [Blastococcus colisei]TQN41008.1 hypothetical protein FHU33_0360 [Blastococcus colisei]
MHRPVAILLLSCLFTALGLVAAAPASACSCVPQTTQQYVERADAVFTARLVSREEPRGTVVSSADPALHVFAVDTVFKGTVAAEQEVVSPVSGATCGLELSGEGPFVVFATRSADLGGTAFATLADDQYASLLCDGSRPATPALEAELAALAGPPEAPAASPRPGAAGTVTADSGPAVSPVTAGALAALLAVLSAGALLLQRRRRG